LNKLGAKREAIAEPDSGERVRKEFWEVEKVLWGKDAEKATEFP